ncbi:MAG: cytochrome P450 [Bacteroidota bacterium]
MNPPAFREPPLIPRWRALQNLLRFVSNPIPVLDNYTQELGDTFCLYMGGKEKAIMTSNPHIIQHVLQKNHRNYRKSAIQVDQLAHFIGKGLLTSEGAYWLQQRRLIQPGFHRNRLAGLVEIMLTEIDLFLDQLSAKADGKQTIDIAQVMLEMAFIIVAKSLFSTGVEKQVLDQLSHNITAIQSYVIRQIRQPYLLPWFKLTKAKQQHEQLAHRSNRIILDIIHQRRQSQTRPDDLLEMLLDARYEDTGTGMNDQQLLEESLILFVAGHETSANALAWTWYLLGQHPEVVQQIREEFNQVLGDRRPQFSDLPQLAYLQRVIQESMRLFPPAWITDRVPIQTDQVQGFEFPKDMIVGLYIYGVHHDPKYWPNPHQFDPSRFEKARIKERPAYAYLPFGGGPRQCIGNNFAMMEIQLILIRMLQRFDLSLVPNQDIQLYPMITLRPKQGIFVTMKKRSIAR